MSNGLIENNVIYENGADGGGCSGINMDGVTDTLVRNNLLYGTHGSGIAVYQHDGGVCSRDNRLLHNTILMASDGRWAITLFGDNLTDERYIVSGGSNKPDFGLAYATYARPRTWGLSARYNFGQTPN